MGRNITIFHISYFPTLQANAEVNGCFFLMNGEGRKKHESWAIQFNEVGAATVEYSYSTCTLLIDYNLPGLCCKRVQRNMISVK